ncbi:MAG TPA: hypothetical protein VH062_25020 [Polyangiaceae bacterium]|nr:hypothetical protein [Polyangiaceae bacterium]
MTGVTGSLGGVSRVFSFVLAALLTALACSGDSPKPLASGCTINTDCDQPLVCAFERCHKACNDSRDCPAGLHCVSSDKPYRVCQLPGEADCTRTSDCPGTEQCAVDGQCHDRCASSADCVSLRTAMATTP